MSDCNVSEQPCASGTATFDSKEMNASATLRVSFTVDGRYKYACSYHGRIQGTIIVSS